MKKQIKLYNVIFPWWLLPAAGVFFSPAVGILLIIAVAAVDWAVDSFVLWLTLRKRQNPRRKEVYKKAWWKIWLTGFAADLVGVLFMLASSMVMTEVFYDHSVPATRWLMEAGNGIMYNPFVNPGSFIAVLLAVILAAVIIYFADRRILEKTPGISFKDARFSALMLAIFTAPWTFFIPTFFY